MMEGRRTVAVLGGSFDPVHVGHLHVADQVWRAFSLSEVILPPLPADFPRDSETIRATFIARGDIMSMRDAFRYMKQIGYF